MKKLIINRNVCRLKRYKTNKLLALNSFDIYAFYYLINNYSRAALLRRSSAENAIPV